MAKVGSETRDDPCAPVAHIADDKREQSLAEHLLQVSKRTRRLAKKIHLEKAGELIGLLHDLGKATAVFQSYLLSFHKEGGVEPQDEMRGKIDHSTAGAQIAWREFIAESQDELARELACQLVLPIVSHHSGLIDSIAPDGEDVLAVRIGKSDEKTRTNEAWRTIDAQVRAQAQSLLRDGALRDELRRAAKHALHGEGNQHATDRHYMQLGLMVRMLFSCLIDADRTDTANFERPVAARLRQEQVYERWDILLGRLEARLAKMPPEGTVNRIRREVSAECSRGALRPAGAYTLTVPTGGGKTLAALRFALQHAVNRAGSTAAVDRVIFVSPYISIVEQNAEVARQVLEPEGVTNGSVVLEHHSNLGLDEQPGERNREHWRRKLLAENWNAPVVFTTMAQVLESLFSDGTRAVRRLHSMARSVLVFDEAQTLPVKLLHPFNNALNYLARECGTTVLLCTATQPRLHQVDAELGTLRLAANAELIGDVDGLFRSLRRYRVTDETGRSGGWNQAEVAESACALACQHGSCLVVLNTKRDVREVFQQCRALLPDAVCVHLSTGMCPAHRAETLKQLKSLLQDQAHTSGAAPILCVSTNLIEAGVDIDFAAVVRDLAGLDSLAQAAGRCNRHGLRDGGGHVLLVRLPDPPAQLEDVLHGRRAAQRVLEEWRRSHPGEHVPLDGTELMDRYFEFWNHERRKEMSYTVSGKQAARSDTLLSMLGKNDLAVTEAAATGRPVKRQLLNQSFMAAGKAFQLIAPTQGVIVPFREEGSNSGEKIIAALCAVHDLEAEWQLLRKAQRYTLNLYDHAFVTLVNAGALYEVKAGSGVYCLRPEWYDAEFGLRTEGGPLELLIG